MMNNKFELPAILIGAIVFFLSGALIWELVLNTFQAEHFISYGHLTKGKPAIWMIALAQIPIAIIFTFIFSRHIPSLNIKKGAIIGAVTCAMFSLSWNFMVLLRMNLIDGFIIITDFIGMLVWGALGGAAIAWALGFRKG